MDEFGYPITGNMLSKTLGISLSASGNLISQMEENRFIRNVAKKTHSLYIITPQGKNALILADTMEDKLKEYLYHKGEK